VETGMMVVFCPKRDQCEFYGLFDPGTEKLLRDLWADQDKRAESSISAVKGSD